MNEESLRGRGFASMDQSPKVEIENKLPILIYDNTDRPNGSVHVRESDVKPTEKD